MKQFAYLMAIAIVGVAFTGCKDNKGSEIEGGGYNGQTVKTQFLISIAENVAGRNNMQADTVQLAQTRGSFRGMDKICLIPFDGDFDARIGKNITLASIPAAAATTAGSLNNASNVYYDNVAIPLGTKRFLFYGKAIDRAADADITTADAKFGLGSLQANGLYGATNNPASISFDPVKIYPSADVPSEAAKLAAFVSSIEAASAGSPAVAWKDHSNSAIRQLHEDFITLKAGSSASILATITDLYNTLERFQATQVSNDAVVDAIMAAIKAGTTGSDAGTEFARVLALKGDADHPANYPASINLPDGAAQIAWNSTAKKFDVVVTGMGGIAATSLTQYVYPANLQYFAKSTIKTSVASQKDKYDGNNNWPTILGYYTDGGEVKSVTKSVAINDPIHYGVGLLQADIKVASTNPLKDQKDATYNFVGFDWSAILIGNQKQVDYEFRQNTSAAVSSIIYDKHMGGSVNGNPIDVAAAGTTYGPNYTLVLSTADNGAAGEAHEDKVYVAVELLNKGAAFFGKDGQLIPANAKFYLVGELKVTSEVGSHPEKFNIFYKDYTTTLHLTIGENSLKSAYNTIPDLRSEGLELGFSVDLAWTPGLEFNVEF